MRCLGWVGLGLALAVVAGCGSSSGSSNEQGVSFQILGVFCETQELQPPSPDLPPTPQDYVSGSVVRDPGSRLSLSQPVSPSCALAPGVPDDRSGDCDPDCAYIGLRNNMISQGVRVERFVFEYSVPGSAFEDTDEVGVSVHLDPAPSSGEESGLTHMAMIQTRILAEDLFNFVAQNRFEFPDPPFDMRVVIRAEGVSASGDPFVTEPHQYTVSFAR